MLIPPTKRNKLTGSIIDFQELELFLSSTAFSKYLKHLEILQSWPLLSQLLWAASSFPVCSKEKEESLSHVWLFETPWTVACTTLLHPRDFLGKSTGVGCHFLLQGIFPTQGSNPGLPHCRQMLSRLSQQGSPCLLYKNTN